MDIIAVDNLSGRQFEGFLEKLLQNLGFSYVKQTPLSGDFGGDIIAEKDGKRWVIQAKRSARTIGVRAVQEAHAAREYYGVKNSMVIANRAFSSRSRELARRCNCTLVDRDVLKEWLGGQFTSSDDLFRFVSEHRITRYRISNDELVRAYRSLREKLARSVRICDMDAQGEYSSSVYRCRWGCWRNFLVEVGDAPMQPTKDDLVAEYKRVRTQAGATPTRSQFDRLSAYSHSTYERIWGSWRGFLDSVGDKPKKKHLIPEDEFVREFKRVRAILGKPPTVKEMAQFGKIAPTTYRRLWGSWSCFLKEMGELYQRRNVPDEELVKAYLKLKKHLRKRTLTQRDMSQYGVFNSSVYERRWGSWTKFLSSIGDSSTRRRDITDDDLKNDYLAVRSKLGKSRCSAADIRKHGRYALSTYLKRFGSWHRLQEIIAAKQD